MEILTRYREPLVEAMDSLLGGPPSPILAMCRYHLGLAEVDGTPTRNSAGKMLRPALCLAMCEALGGDIHRCLPTALSLELTHRTSLIFDDVQDRSPQRNHRPTIWGVWGVDQALNAGLALSCYARLALHGMAERGVSPGTFHEIQRLLEQTVIDLTRGQYLDIHFQQAMSPESFPTLDEYLEMARLKTGVLLGTACEVGALVAGAYDRRVASRQFGEALGVAFQLQDDILGVWGNPEETGKVANDLTERKWSLPIVLVAQHRPNANETLERSQESEYLQMAYEVHSLSKVRNNAVAMSHSWSRRAEASLEGINLAMGWTDQLGALIQALAGRSA